ncbi:GGDEF domain-containing protein [Sulfurimonas sp.]|uniref:GGDEF domain-containing protein n=1 Tax=Sulfurimonas sp. TaxID=2022749 RepID=UPI0025EE3C47|nr:GGDEF domain-containing protein [Sulfurimonas sp.]MDD5157594.1 GGDEF domain-containing protein [Sulfurimonas sp.]
MRKYIVLFVSLFIMALGAHFLVLSMYIQSKKNDFLQLHNKSAIKSFEIVGSNFSRLSESIFNTAINKPYVLEKMIKAYGTQDEKNSARSELYEELFDEYTYLRGLGIVQLHFQLRNSESFLRFENPEKYGDNLTYTRKSVEWTNANQTKTEGFEEGVFYNGFRYIFPLIKIDGTKKEHLGSVEFTFSPYAFINDLINYQDIKAEFIVSSNDDTKKNIVTPTELRYTESPFDGFMYEKSIKKELNNNIKKIEIEKITKSDSSRASRDIFKGDVFSIPSGDSFSVFTFIPIKNSVSKKVVSAIILQENSDEIKELDNQFFLFLFSGYGVILMAILYIYREVNSRVKFQNISKKTQKILDAQEAIVVILDRAGVISVNRKFLNFFGCSSLSDFKAKNRCICERFEQNDKFFHIGKVKNDGFWIDALSELSDREHIVSMKDKNNKFHSFAIFINSIDNSYIVSFSDISETMREHFSLEQKAMHDSLTNAYNREYFQENINFIIEESCKKELHVGVVMFDIDYFKNVNDTYGHSVGDFVLKYLVWSVGNVIRSEDLLIRWGGEEFLLIIQTKSIEELILITQKIRETIEGEDFKEVKQITCSFGVTLHMDNEDISNSIKRADDALYEAKESGRNRVVSKV